MGKFRAHPEFPLLGFQPQLAPVLVSFEFWLVAEQAGGARDRWRGSILRSGVGEVLAQESRLRRLRLHVEEACFRSDARKLQEGRASFSPGAEEHISH